METELFDDHVMFTRPSHTLQGSSAVLSDEMQLKARAVVDLLRSKVLSQSYGEEGEYEVRTTISTRQAWRYQCRVLRHGRVLKREFPPIAFDRTPDMREAAAITEEMRIAFATEAVDMHFARCAAVKEYLIMAAILSQPSPRDFRRLRIIMAIAMCAAVAAAYWFWKEPILAALNPLPAPPPPHTVQWERKEVFYTHLAGKPFTFPLPALNGASRDAPVEVSMDASNWRPTWIQFNRETRRLSGVAPIAEADKTYYLPFLAKANGSSESRLDVYLTITGQQEPLQSPSLRPSMLPSAASPDLDSSGERQSRLGRQAISSPLNPARESDCLLKILKGESC
jgi:hypothetical protein